MDRFNTLSPVQSQFPNEPYYSIVEPQGCFVPTKPLPFIQKNDVTRHHYIVPSFAAVGESQAKVMKLIFNYTDSTSFKPKEEYERTIPWHIDGNSSLVTLSQHTSAGRENPVTRNYLLGLGQRLGITTIIVIVSIEVINTIYPLLDNLVKSMEVCNTSNLIEQDQATWWSRVVIIVNQQHGVTDQAAYNQRKEILTVEMPRIQERYRLSHPLSVLFLSTLVYDNIKNPSQAFHYKSCCQRILWQMMEKHMLSGRWCSELISLQNRVDTNLNGGSLLNVLNEDDESSSSSDDALFKTVIDYVDGKKKKPVKRKNTPAPALPPIPAEHAAPPSTLQRRATRRQIQIQTQKLHSHDGDDGTTLPVSDRRS
ncbi:uncharacterized protein EV154DRAFT_11818 [Mucor mucedo]|uniref:uncharacterized protein n=1 Tax=Mucor mucedo TaxID=29922 RepID=UPI00221EFA3D|nr:uncharacterized protein EV154DRAFT_11818 [Mucor mucedo]KAI7887657.1 hypothetical protein EV154DRAFT_11818 [Mucor mucedo]